ncbi:MAG TPA: DUF4169 family protein [Rhizomicrobium sp.]|jgi:hypothetical protein|nr:DUF4169 family protein [Rhizomicrobium sp.]
MGTVVNLRRAKKAKARDQAGKDAAANRLKHGTPKASRAAAAAEKARAGRAVDSHKIEND